MDPDRIIVELCARFGVSEDFGKRLLPLISRAQKSPTEAKKRIMDMVERSFAQEALRATSEAGTHSLSTEDKKILQTVARILHNWEPPRWLKTWGKLQSGENPPPEFG